MLGMPLNDVQIAVRIPGEVAHSLRTQADARRRTLASEVRGALRLYHVARTAWVLEHPEPAETAHARPDASLERAQAALRHVCDELFSSTTLIDDLLREGL